MKKMPAVPPTEIKKPEAPAPAPKPEQPPRHIVIEIRGDMAAIVKSDCASSFELRQILEDLLVSMTKR